MYDEDSFGLKRLDLGDKSCEVLFAIKKRNKDFGQAGNGNNNLNSAGGGFGSQMNNNQVSRPQGIRASH